MQTIRRFYLDNNLYGTDWHGKVLDVGGKKYNKRGKFRPPISKVECWDFINIDASTRPDFIASAYRLPFNDSTYDIVALIEVLEHLQYPENALEEAYRVLKSNGKLIISIPFLFPIHADPNDYQRWTKIKLFEVISSIGFRKIDIKEMGSVFGVMYDLLYVFLNDGKNTLTKKIVRKIVNIKVIYKMIVKMDGKSINIMQKITTGYYCVIEK